MERRTGVGPTMLTLLACSIAVGALDEKTPPAEEDSPSLTDDSGTTIDATPGECRSVCAYTENVRCYGTPPASGFTVPNGTPIDFNVFEIFEIDGVSRLSPATEPFTRNILPMWSPGETVSIWCSGEATGYQLTWFYAE